VKAQQLLAKMLLVLLSACENAETEQPIPRDIIELIEKTRTTQSTYSLYTWNNLTPPDGRVLEEWSAEFHSGKYHRVETPRDRVVADCEAMTGTHLNLATSKFEEGENIAKAACGVNANQKILAARRIQPIETKFGAGEGIEIIDPRQVRTYYVSKEGVLLAATISGKEKDRPLWLKNRVIQLENTLPAQDIFSFESLSRSVVPERWKQPPEGK
jgi:hypothetical protein